MKKEVYRVLAYYPPETRQVAANYWVSAGKDKTELPTGFDPEDIQVYADGVVKSGETLEDGMFVVDVSATVPADVELRKTVRYDGE